MLSAACMTGTATTAKEGGKMKRTPKLMDYRTGATIRDATAAELADSIERAAFDSGAGVIEVSDHTGPVYVE